MCARSVGYSWTRGIHRFERSMDQVKRKDGMWGEWLGAKKDMRYSEMVKAFCWYTPSPLVPPLNVLNASATRSLESRILITSPWCWLEINATKWQKEKLHEKKGLPWLSSWLVISLKHQQKRVSMSRDHSIKSSRPSEPNAKDWSLEDPKERVRRRRRANV